jgi:hypothetical protein
MRAAALTLALALAGCASAGSDGTSAPNTTGLVLSLHFDHTGVNSVEITGATSTTARSFGPYYVAEDDLPRDSTVGLVFDASDAGSAMVCAESHDLSGKVLGSGCDTFDVVSAQVTQGSLTLVDPAYH